MLNTYFQSSKIVMFTPVAALQHGSPITFQIPATTTLWMDLCNSYFQFEVKMVKPDGTAADKKVGVINDILNSMFSMVDIDLGGKSVSDQNNLYPYHAMFESLCYSGFDPDNAFGELQGYNSDTTDAAKDFDAEKGKNKGLVFRSALIDGDSGGEVVGKLKADIFKINSPIIPGVSLKVKLVPSRDNFMLVSPAPAADAAQVQYQFRITSAKFYVKMMEATNAFMLQTIQYLKREPMHYTLTHSTMKHHAISTGQTTFDYDNAFLGPRPKRIYIALVPDAAMSGGYQRNPFYLNPIGLEYYQLTFNGTPVMDGPYTPNFENGKYIKSLYQVYRALNLHNSTTKSLALSRDDYDDNKFFIVYSLSTEENPAAIDPPQSGTTRLELKFSKPLPETINVILKADYDAFIDINEHGQVVTSF